MKYKKGETITFDSGYQYWIKDIKEGGMGIVYICKASKYSSGEWAFKTFKESFFKKTSIYKSFVNECKLWISLGRHPFIIEARSIETLNGQPFVEMACKSLGSLELLLDEDGEPVVSRDSNGFLFNIEPVNIWDIAYTWEPKPVGEPVYGRLHAVDIIRTYHSWGAPSLFKPSIAEVLAQIPIRYVHKISNFHILNGDMDVRHVLSDGYHAVLTKLFTDDHDWWESIRK